MSRILFAEHQYEITGFVTGSNGNQLARYSSSLTPNVLFAGVLDREQQERDLEEWASQVHLSSRQTGSAPGLLPLINLPVQPPGGSPGGTNAVIQQPNNPVDDPIVITPEPGTSLLGLGLLLILIFQKKMRRTAS
jgi:hypothetical protein